jgi:hypothetical protein
MAKAGISRSAVPQSFIERVAIDAKAADSVEAQVLTLEGKPVGQTFLSAGSGDFPVARFANTGLESPVNRQAGKPALHLATRIASPKQWAAETPKFYTCPPRRPDCPKALNSVMRQARLALA